MADWDKILGRFGDWGRKTVAAAQLVARYKEFCDLFDAPREQGQEIIERIVEANSPEALTGFETELLQYSLQMLKPTQRIRAMELYAWLKLVETRQYREFRGFVADGD